MIRKVVFCLMFAMLAAAPAQAGTFDDWYNGADGYKNALKKSQNAQAPMALLFYTDWCPYCRRLNQGLLADEDVQRGMRKLIKVRINPEDGDAEQQLYNQYQGNGYPTFLIVQGDGSSPTKIDTSGSAEDLIAVCRQAVQTAALAKAAEPEPVPVAVAAPAHPVTLFMKQGGTVQGDLVEETVSAVVVGWPYGTATFSKDTIERIEHPATQDSSL